MTFFRVVKFAASSACRETLQTYQKETCYAKTSKCNKSLMGQINRPQSGFHQRYGAGFGTHIASFHFNRASQSASAEVGAVDQDQSDITKEAEEDIIISAGGMKLLQ
ncbi:Hypothetical predicted protein [Scomber scombrus]|uniref:Uncharacterized protein n=1 Tax=Scomber scombrus TaxID=13677 RepID=A0AAV1NPC5_SCOSC